MQYVFLALMCVFAGFSAAKSSRLNRGINTDIPKDQKAYWGLLSRLFFRSAAGVMVVLIVVGSRTGAREQTYYTLILIGLCVSLAADVLYVLISRGRKYFAACLSFLFLAGIFYICAFYAYAAFSWRDAALFALLLIITITVMYNKDRLYFKRLPVLLFSAAMCAVSAKAVSMLFIPNAKYFYAVFTAVGAGLFALSNLMLLYSGSGSKVKRPPVAANTLMYYAGQALIAFSVMI